MTFPLQFRINKPLTNCTRLVGLCNFFLLVFETYLALIYSKLHSKSFDYLLTDRVLP